MLLSIIKNPRKTLHPGRLTPGTGAYEFISSDDQRIVTRDLSDNTIKEWERWDYDFTATGTTGALTTGVPGLGTADISRIVATGAGSIAAGAKSITVINTTGVAGVFMGTALSGNSTNSFSASPGNSIGEVVTYDATGTTFEILIVT